VRSILLQSHIGRPEQCFAWANIPMAQGAQVTIYANAGTPDIENCARQCFTLLNLSFATLGGTQQQPPCIIQSGHIGPAYGCLGAAVGGHKRILIYIADGTAMIDPLIKSYFLQPGALIIPVVDTSLGTDYPNLLPASFNTHIVEPIHSFDCTPLIPRLQRVAGISSKGWKLFISYRHADAGPIASQLFHKLSESMFDVFLDRFSSRTTDDFVTLVKACVLVLETDKIGHSVYCRQEVATALAYKLGLMAVELPRSVCTFPQIPTRHNLLSAVLTPAGTLDQNDLDSLVRFVEAHYGEQITRRWRHQDKTVYDALIAEGLTPQPIGVGQYRVDNGHVQYLVSITSCPPDIEDFMRTDDLSRQPPVAQNVLLGPIAVLQTARGDQTAWLGKKTGAIPIDEAYILRTAKNIANNQPL